MFGIHDFWLFVLSAILLTLTPGQDTLYIVGRSISQGRRAGVLSVMGICTGCIVHTTAAAFGLSQILAASAFAFSLVRYAGAGYLLYLGARMLMERSQIGSAPIFSHQSSAAIYRQGFWTNLLNPKVALFFLSFLPQFITPASARHVLAPLILSLTFLIIGTSWCLVLALAAARVSRRLRHSPTSGIMLRRTTGGVFLGLGLKLAVNR